MKDTIFVGIIMGRKLVNEEFGTNLLLRLMKYRYCKKLMEKSVLPDCLYIYTLLLKNEVRYSAWEKTSPQELHQNSKNMSKSHNSKPRILWKISGKKHGFWYIYLHVDPFFFFFFFFAFFFLFSFFCAFFFVSSFG